MRFLYRESGSAPATSSLKAAASLSNRISMAWRKKRFSTLKRRLYSLASISKVSLVAGSTRAQEGAHANDVVSLCRREVGRGVRRGAEPVHDGFKCFFFKFRVDFLRERP